LYSSIPGQAIPSAFGHYDSAATVVSPYSEIRFPRGTILPMISYTPSLINGPKAKIPFQASFRTIHSTRSRY
ncbi:hypothetical protein, partial [Paenibacillus alginolyticus]